MQGVHVVVGTPQMIVAAMAEPEPVAVVQHCKVVAGELQRGE